MGALGESVFRATRRPWRPIAFHEPEAFARPHPPFAGRRSLFPELRMRALVAFFILAMSRA